MASKPIVRVENLSVLLEGGGEPRPVLADISFDVAPRSVLGIIGESGSGKTVLSNALVNWIKLPLRVTSGQVLYQGRNLLGLPEHEMAKLRGREIAYIGANPTIALDPTIPVGHQIVEKLREVEPGISREAARKRVIDTLDAVRIPSAARRFDEYPFQFSGGMMQRAMIVDALVSNPKLLIADNITQPLDVTVAAQIIRLLRDLQSDFETSIVFISSALGVVSDIADDVIVINAGRIVERQTAARITSAPEHAYTRDLIAKVPRLWAAAETPEPTLLDDMMLEVRDVERTYVVPNHTKLFGENHVRTVRGVTFDVRRGESFGLIGESGCGKSTLSRLLSSIEQPDKGTIKVEGRDIAGLKGKPLLDMRRRFQLLLQDPYNAVPAHASVGRTIEEPLRIHGLASGAALKARVRDVMAEVGLSPDLYESLPVGLSAGQRQRINIARALILEPSLMILDETLSALDQVEQARLLALFEVLQRRHGITYLYISHDLTMVRRVCARIGVMYLGRIVELADNQTIFETPAHPYTRTLLSSILTVEPKPFRPETYLLEGEPPDPIHIPTGCSFRTRCPFAFDRCATDDPELAADADGNGAACHLAPGQMPPPTILPATTGPLAAPNA